MPNSFRRSVSAGTRTFVPALLLCFLSLTATQAIGQDAPTVVTPLQKVLSRFDLGVVAAGEIGTKVSGIEQRDEAIDVEEWPDASDFFRCMHRLIRPAELGIGRGKSGMVEIVARASAEARL